MYSVKRSLRKTAFLVLIFTRSQWVILNWYTKMNIRVITVNIEKQEDKTEEKPRGAHLRIVK